MSLVPTPPITTSYCPQCGSIIAPATPHRRHFCLECHQAWVWRILGCLDADIPMDRYVRNNPVDWSAA